MLMIIEVVLSDFLRVWWVRSVRTPNYEAWFFIPRVSRMSKTAIYPWHYFCHCWHYVEITLTLRSVP